MQFTTTHPLITHPYHPDLVTGSGIASLARAAEQAGFGGYGFTDHPAPSACPGVSTARRPTA